MGTSSGNSTRFFTREFNPASYETGHPNLSQYRPLHRAILEGDWERVKEFYKSHPGAETDSITESKDTAVMVGVMSGQKIEFIKNQVEFGRVDLRRVNKEGNTALHEAAIAGQKAAKFLVGEDRSLLSICNSDGYLPLHLAAAYGQREILIYFLRVGEEHNLQLSDLELDMLMHLEITARFFDNTEQNKNIIIYELDDDDGNDSEYNIHNEDNILHSNNIPTERYIKRLDELTEKDVFEMTFDSKENGERFYNSYAKVKGFSIRRD
ncbi:unnamed protein product [Camellia sinensis]